MTSVAQRKDTRRTARDEFPSEVKLQWEEAGARKAARAVGHDFSAKGLSVESLCKLPLKTLVRMESSLWKAATYAHVRHCTQKGGKYLIGLEFRD
jgi:hypothetical protein